MNLVLVALFILMLGAGLVWWWGGKHKVDDSSAEMRNLTIMAQEEADQQLQIVIGQDASHPIVTLQAFTSFEQYELARPLDIQDSSISRISALCQAVPSMLLAEQAAGRRLVEVVVNGDLARAADGNGLRGFVVGPNGVQEHARFFDVENLQKMINVAAVWQIASVIVAQKHLADISQKLDEIKVGVTNISRYLDDVRKADIESTFKYLKQAYQAIKEGELSPSIRIELESCDRELQKIQIHLRTQFIRKISDPVPHNETFGTKELAAGISKKMEELDELSQDITSCASTRILAWHILSLYPGEPHLKRARQASIQEEIDLIQQIRPQFENVLDKEINELHSKFNFSSTLEERRTILKGERGNFSTQFGQFVSGNVTKLSASAEALISHDEPNKIYLEFDMAGVLVGAREMRQPHESVAIIGLNT